MLNSKGVFRHVKLCLILKRKFVLIAAKLGSFIIIILVTSFTNNDISSNIYLFIKFFPTDLEYSRFHSYGKEVFLANLLWNY